MTEIIGVRFKGNGKEYYFNPGGVKVEPGQQVVVETSGGTEIGECTSGNREVDEMSLLAPLRPMQRIATAQDLRAQELNREKERSAFEICENKIAEHGLDMKLVSAEYSLEGNKVLFLFTSDDRVDFRALVKDLASSLHARIELRQIGVRDEAKMLGGLGICGRPFCCSTCLGNFQPVSIKMAKVQGLSLSPTKISGTCGRLMCCLKYEQEAYEDLVRRVPRVDSFVETPDGAGTISSVNLLRETARVRLDSAPESPKNYRTSELRVIRSGKGKRPDDYVEPPKEELESLRYVDPEAEGREKRSDAPDGLTGMAESFFAAEAGNGQQRSSTQRPAGGEKSDRRTGEPGGEDGHHRRGSRRRGQGRKQTPPAGEDRQSASRQEKPAPRPPRQEANAQSGQQQAQPKPETAGEGGRKSGGNHRRWHRRGGQNKKPGTQGQGPSGGQ